MSNIQWIYADSEIGPGTVTVHIVRDPNTGGGPGCTELGGVHLLNAEDSELGECRVLGDACTESFGIQVDRVSGPVVIGGDVVAAIQVAESGGTWSIAGDVRDRLVVNGAIRDAISIGGNCERFYCTGELVAGVTIAGSVGTTLLCEMVGERGSISVLGSAYSIVSAGVDPDGEISVGGNVPLATIDGTMAGLFKIAGTLGILDVSEGAVVSGTLAVNTKVAGPAKFKAGSALSGVFESAQMEDVRFEAGSVLSGRVETSYLQDLTCRGTVPGVIRVTEELSGLLRLAAAGSSPAVLSGQIYCEVVLNEAVIRVGDPNAPTGEIRGEIVVGDVKGNIVVNGSLNDPNADGQGGHIRVLRTLGVLNEDPPPAEEPMILVTTAFDSQTPTEYITVDYYGDLIGTSWAPTVRIMVGSTVYGPGLSGFNTLESRIWDVTDCKGDMDNDGDVDFDDIDPFVAALEPGTTYNQTWFGLDGSRVFHGDFTGDGLVTFDDLDPFIARLGYCSPQGGYLDEGGGEGDGDGGGGDGGMMMSAGGGTAGQAAALAAQLRASVSAERMDTLIDAVTALAANPPDGSTIPWDLVLVELLD